VTDRGKLVAYLVPADRPTSVFEQLVATGQVQRATKLVKPEPETAAMAAFVDGRTDFVASALLAIEARPRPWRHLP
jgi:antitoxin (DNA-binding transcriptional repressor) of toxin-antitoxin stability system